MPKLMGQSLCHNIYPPRSFHAVVFLKLAPGGDVIDEARTLRDIIETPGGGLVVYAGQVGVAMVTSKQILNDWDALLIVQYPTRSAYDQMAARDDYRELLARLDATYTQGFRRPCLINLMLPQALLGLRAMDILRRVPSHFPFEPAGDDLFPRLRAKLKEVKQLEKLRHLSEDAVLIVNLILPGNKAQRSADRAYTRQMLGAMAEGAHGPLHMGAAVTLEGDANFKQVFAVYYPGVDHVCAMVGSTFMNRIGEGKQLGDSLAVATVPFLTRL